MKTTGGYVVRQLADTFYILPTGQRIADRRRCLKINQTGCVIWDLLQKDLSWKELLAAYTEYVNQSVGTESKKLSEQDLIRDLSTYVQTLFQFGMIQLSDDEMQAFPFAEYNFKERCHTYFHIAGIRVYYEGRQEWLHSFLQSFSEPADEITKKNGTQTIKNIPVQNWYVKPLSQVPEISGKMLLFGTQMDIYHCDTYYMLRFPSNHHLVLCTLSFDGKEAVFYYDGATQQEAVDELFYGFRTVFFYFAALHGKYAIHSASNCYQGKAWLYSAPSGTGKTTHIKLWEQLYHTAVFNGDLNLIGIEDRQAFVYGIPWCGTSGHYSTGKMPLGGIILLKRGTQNKVCILPEDEKQLFTAQRMISPTWTPKQNDANLLFAKELSMQIPIWRIYCTQQPSAAEVMKEAIDRYQEQAMPVKSRLD